MDINKAKKIVDKNRISLQVITAIRELSELSAVLSQSFDTIIDIDKIVDRIAGTSIAVNQLIYIFDCETLVKARINKKLNT